MNRFDERFWISMAVLTVAFAFDVMVYSLPSKADTNLVATIVGVLNTVGIMGVKEFWLGSSKGSQDKDATISNMAQRKE